MISYKDNIVGRIRGIVATLLLLILSLYYVNITMCYHTHISNGVAVVHSHFYLGGHVDGDDLQSDPHSDEEFVLIKELSKFIVDQQHFTTHVVIFLPVVGWVYREVLCGAIANNSCSYPQLRAPPVA